MIVELSLENFLFMKNSEISFFSGLNVITGETGAGKSILLEAVKLLLGKKARSGIVLPGCSKARIQALFNISTQEKLKSLLEEQDLLDEDEPNSLSISRSFRQEGGGKVMVNGTMTTIGFLKKIGPQLMEIHGQNDHQTLLQPDIQRKLLDRSGGQKMKDSLSKLSKIYKDKEIAQRNFHELEKNQENSAAKIKELHELAQSLASLNLNNESEENDLKEQSKKMEHAEQILSALQIASLSLSGADEVSGISELTYKAIEALNNISQYDTRFETILERLNNTYYDMREVESELENISDETILNPDQLYEIQARLSDISRACRKHNTDFKGLFILKEETSKLLEDLYEPNSSKKLVLEKLNMLTQELLEASSEVTKLRAKLAEKFSAEISSEMSLLGFNSSKFTVSLSKLPEITQHGAETVDFEVSLNPGAPSGSLRKIASGGELSRVALAIKKVFALSDDLPTLLFDEIDTGIGGKTAEAVASSLSALGKTKQVLLVTHLHQIAKEGTSHFTVTKSVEDDNTHISIQKVQGVMRTKEIARMLGRTDEKGVEFAKSLLRTSIEK